jgi:DHA1 family multidrug resistance protein-like MFS transporter
MKEAAKMDKSLIMFLLALTLATIAATNLTKYVDAYITIDLGKSTGTLGVFVMITGVVGIFTNFVIVPLLLRLRRNFAIMKWLQIPSAILIFFVFRANDAMLALYTLYMGYVVLKSIFQPLEQNYISLNAKDEKYGTIMGVRQMFFSVGMVIGPLFAGFIYDYNPRLVFDISASMFLFAFILLMLSQNALKKQQNHNPVLQK